MADNPVIKAGTTGNDVTVAGDDVGGAIHQYVKLEFGGDGTATKVEGNVGLPVEVVENIPSTIATRTQVADSATNVTIIAANSARKGVTIWNDSSATLYLGLGTVDVTTSNYTVRLVAGAYYEAPYNYTGAIEGLWASDPGDGGAKITELT